MLEAVTLTGAGGLIGILLGFAFALLVRLAVSFPANVPMWAIAAGLLACSRACGLPCVRRDWTRSRRCAVIDLRRRKRK